jgi:hypothetical protein
MGIVERRLEQALNEAAEERRQRVDMLTHRVSGQLEMVNLVMLTHQVSGQLEIHGERNRMSGHYEGSTQMSRDLHMSHLLSE